jgi:hypothetical protein
MSAKVPCLSLAIDRLRAGSPNHFVIHAIQAPYRSGYLLTDSLWSETQNQIWQSWQEFFSSRGLPMVPYISEAQIPTVPTVEPSPGQPMSQSMRLMQTLGMELWQWLVSGSIQGVLSQSQGIAMGQNRALRLRLDIRDPDLIPIPWEIMQHQPGRPAVSMSQNILFSRTTSDVDTLEVLRSDQSLHVLIVLGEDSHPEGQRVTSGAALRLNQEAQALTRLLTSSTQFGGMAPCTVDTLVQPTSSELVQAIQTERYNVMLYAGHGMPAPDGGMLFLRPDMAMNGTELAQLLTRGKVKLAVFNACWGAQPDQQGHQPIPRSSLAEVLLHHGVPAVLAMRESITDQEAISFIQSFVQALAERRSIDQAVAIARQQLLTLFKFNQQAWTLPVLYMHPDFDGELIQPLIENRTQIPMPAKAVVAKPCYATLRSTVDNRMWYIESGLMRVGMSVENDVVLPAGPGVSRKHAEIFCRLSPMGEQQYFLRDISRYGTWISQTNGWQQVTQQEVAIPSGSKIKFGTMENMPLEFLVSHG